MMATAVPAGFPSPAEDYLDQPLDFNELMIANPAATFAVRVEGDSMIGAGIHPGDIAVVDRSLPAKDGRVVLALIDGSFTLKRFRKRNGRIWLAAENPNYVDMIILAGMSFEVWGCVRRCVRMLEP
jgi:DNA polymerase V